MSQHFKIEVNMKLKKMWQGKPTNFKAGDVKLGVVKWLKDAKRYGVVKDYKIKVTKQ